MRALILSERLKQSTRGSTLIWFPKASSAAHFRPRKLLGCLDALDGWQKVGGETALIDASVRSRFHRAWQEYGRVVLAHD
jgi:hypothetical protein